MEVIHCTTPVPAPRLPDLGMVRAKAGPCSSPWIIAVTEIHIKGWRNMSERAMVSGSVWVCKMQREVSVLIPSIPPLDLPSASHSSFFFAKIPTF